MRARRRGLFLAGLSLAVAAGLGAAGAASAQAPGAGPEEAVPPSRSVPSGAKPAKGSAMCGVCHSDIRVKYEKGVHKSEGVPCTSCHGGNPGALTVEGAHGDGFRGKPARRSIPALCASCHARMDPLGFALENYDAIGKWRTQDGKFPVDPSGTFPNGKSFTTPAGMKELLKEDLPEFARCLTEKLLTYSLGRGVESYDRRTVQDIVRQAAAQEYRFQSFIQAIVKSVPFQQRRGPGKEEQTK